MRSGNLCVRARAIARAFTVCRGAAPGVTRPFGAGCVPAARRGEAAGETKSGQAIKRETMGKAKKHAGLAVLLAVLLAGWGSACALPPAAASADGDRRFCAGRNLPHRAGGGQYLRRPQRTARLAAVAGGQFDVALQSDLAPEPYQPRRNRYARPLYRQLHPDGRHDQPRERRPSP